MPRSRSKSMLSRSCAAMSRAATVLVASSSRSARVLFPWSMWAMMLKFRIRALSYRGMSADGRLPLLLPAGEAEPPALLFCCVDDMSNAEDPRRRRGIVADGGADARKGMPTPPLRRRKDKPAVFVEGGTHASTIHRQLLLSLLLSQGEAVPKLPPLLLLPLRMCKCSRNAAAASSAAGSILLTTLPQPSLPQRMTPPPPPPRRLHRIVIIIRATTDDDGWLVGWLVAHADSGGRIKLRRKGGQRNTNPLGRDCVPSRVPTNLQGVRTDGQTCVYCRGATASDRNSFSDPHKRGGMPSYYIPLGESD
jgi:hypothetical protein